MPKMPILTMQMQGQNFHRHLIAGIYLEHWGGGIIDVQADQAGECKMVGTIVLCPPLADGHKQSSVQPFR